MDIGTGIAVGCMWIAVAAIAFSPACGAVMIAILAAGWVTFIAL